MKSKAFSTIVVLAFILAGATFFMATESRSDCSCDGFCVPPQAKRGVQKTPKAKHKGIYQLSNVKQKVAGQTATTLPKPKEVSAMKVTFVELGSVKCIPCKMMQPIMKEIEEEYKEQVKVVFYDVWTPEGKPYADKYGIRAIPTQIFLDKDGNEYFRHTGFFSKDELVKILKMKGVE